MIPEAEIKIVAEEDSAQSGAIKLLFTRSPW